MMSLDLKTMPVGGCVFVPALRTAPLLADVLEQAEALRARVSYRITVVDGKYGVLFTRLADGRGGLTNEDRKES